MKGGVFFRSKTSGPLLFEDRNCNCFILTELQQTLNSVRMSHSLMCSCSQ